MEGQDTSTALFHAVVSFWAHLADRRGKVLHHVPGMKKIHKEKTK